MNRKRLSDGQRRWLETELADWRAQDLLSADQAGRILDRYETHEEVGTRKRSLAVFALQGMAAFLFALAVLLLIGFNWEVMPSGLKLATVLVGVTVVHGLGGLLRFRWQRPLAAEVMFFFGCLLFGAGIWLIAQVFHIQAHYPDGVWWWALGVLPFALALDSLLLHLLLVALLAIWSGMEVLGYYHVRHVILAGWWPLPGGAYSLPLLALPGLIWAYRKPSPFALGIYLPLLVWWVALQAVAWGWDPHSVFWLGALGGLLLLVAEGHRVGDAMAIPYRLWGTVLSVGCLIPLSSTHFWAYGLSWQYGEIGWLWGQLPVAVMLAATATVLFVLSRRARREETGRLELRHWFPAALVAALAMFSWWSTMLTGFDSIPFRPQWDEVQWLLADPLVLVPTLLFNAALVALAVYLVRVGIREERVRPFAAGVLVFLVWAGARYVDLFNVIGGMLGGAVLFALSGLALAAVARFYARVRHARQEQPRPRTVATAWTGPAWLGGLAGWLSARRGGVLVTAAVLQVLFLGGMAAAEAVPFVVGEKILLKVQPVDPRDLFRGDYVVLDYGFSRLPWEGPGYDHSAAGPVYVVLGEEDGHYRGVALRTTPPTDGRKYLKGQFRPYDYRQPYQFGIESFYVQEGRGLALERQRNERRLAAEIVVAPSGKAKLNRLIPLP